MAPKTTNLDKIRRIHLWSTYLAIIVTLALLVWGLSDWVLVLAISGNDLLHGQPDDVWNSIGWISWIKLIAAAIGIHAIRLIYAVTTEP